MNFSVIGLMQAVLVIPLLAAAGVALTGLRPNLREGISLVSGALCMSWHTAVYSLLTFRNIVFCPLHQCPHFDTYQHGKWLIITRQRDWALIQCFDVAIRVIMTLMKLNARL